MKNWNTPTVEELEVKLTASGWSAGTEERDSTHDPVNYPVTHNQATHEYVITGESYGGVIEGCVQPISAKESTGS